ncbi:MAG: hypothetical protein CL961_00390 [Euryarchaeota archaeon]|nr:hypothetical protein [Euryarchaeota archaeon]
MDLEYLKKINLSRKIHDFCRIFKQLKKANFEKTKDHITIKEDSIDTYENRFEHDLINCDRHFSIKYPKIEKFKLRDVYVVGQDGFVFTKKKELIYDGAILKNKNLKKVRFPIKSLSKKLKGEYFHLCGINSENHGHFVTQFLPRILILKEYLNLHADVNVLVSFGQRRWQKIYINALGIKSDRIVECNYGTLKIDVLNYIPFFHGNDGLVPKEYYLRLQNIFKNLIRGENVKKEKILFLSRENAPNRRLNNEREVIDLIKKKFDQPVHKVLMEKHSLPEQIRLCQEATHIFGPQGQAFLACLFASNAKIVILELFIPNWNMRDWAESFRNLGLYSGNKVARLYSKVKYDHNRNWFQPLDEAEKFIDKLLNNNH